MKELLALRKKLKKKKPKFYSQEYHKKIRLGKRWRKPRGTDSKVRLKLKGHVNRVSVGYGSPRKVRGLTRDGLNTLNLKGETRVLKLLIPLRNPL